MAPRYSCARTPPRRPHKLINGVPLGGPFSMKLLARRSTCCFICRSHYWRNVYEWTQDWYGPYSNSRVTDPTGASSGSFRVVRGGGGGMHAEYCRSAFRYFLVAGLRGFGLGFRLVRTPSTT